MKYYSLLVVIGILISNVAVSADCEHPLKAGWEHWPPYQYINDENELAGLDIELLKAIAKEAGCTVQLYEIPWKRHLLQIKSGQIDIALGASYEKSRAEYAHFSIPLRPERMSLFVLKNKAKQYHIKNLTEISEAKFSLGTTLGYYYGEEYKNLMNKAAFKSQVQELHTDKLNYAKLFHERIDGFIADPISTTHQVSNLKNTRPLSILFDVHNDDVHLMLSKKSIDISIVEKINRAMKALQKSGRYKKIVDSYLKANSKSNEPPLIAKE